MWVTSFGVHSLPRPCVLSNPQSGPVQEIPSEWCRWRGQGLVKTCSTVTQLSVGTQDPQPGHFLQRNSSHSPLQVLTARERLGSLQPPPLSPSTILFCFAVQRHSGICLRFWELIYFKGWHHLSPNWVSASPLWRFLFSLLKQRPGTMLFSRQIDWGLHIVPQSLLTWATAASKTLLGY